MNTPTIESAYFYRLRDIAQMRSENIVSKLLEFLSSVKPKKLRSSQQNRAIHKDCDLIAEKLNDAGLDMKKVLKKEIDIPWTMDSVKEYMFKPIMKAMYQKESTSELEKNSNEIEKIHDVLMRELGEKWQIEYHPFPHDSNKKKAMEREMEMPKPYQGEYPNEEEEGIDLSKQIF